jgi:8-oxo-dGTP diphosphatase
MASNLFNIRVYGILINDGNQVLVSDELIRGRPITKFPGGGLEFGEGTRDCLAREFMEEMMLRVEVTDHFYTTDFYIQSAFNPAHQIISVYYHVQPLEPLAIVPKTTPFDFGSEQLAQHEATGETEVFRFIDLHHFNEDCMTLPIDKVVAGLLKKT